MEPKTVARQYPNYPVYRNPQPGPASVRGRSRFARYLRRHWWLPALTTSIALCLVAFYVLSRPPAYFSQASLWVSGKVKLSEGTLYSEELQFFSGTQIELLQSENLQARAANRVTTLKPELKSVPVKLTVRQTPRTTIIVVETSGPEPAYTQAFLEALVDEYFAYRKEIRAASSDDTLSSLTRELEQQEEQLKAAQDQLLADQRDTSPAMLQEQNNSATSYLTKLTLQQADLRIESQMIESMAAARSDNSEGTDPDPGGALKTSNLASARAADYLSARQRVEMLKRDRDEFARNLRPQHPKIRRLNEEIARAEELLGVFHKESRDQLAASRQSVLQKMQTVDDLIKEWEQKVRESTQRLADIERHRLEVQRAQGICDRLHNMLQGIDPNRNLDQEIITRMHGSSVAAAKPRGLIEKLARAGLVGLTLGLGLLYFMESSDDRFNSMAEFADRFPEEEMLGQVPQVRRDRRTGQVRLVEPHDLRHAFAESMRNLRSSLILMACSGHRPKLLLVTSAVPGEGKSTVAINLALALAFTDARVLLVDGDLRRGALNRQLGLLGETGLAELLTHEPVFQGDKDSAVQLMIRTLSQKALRSNSTLTPDDARLLKETIHQLDEIMAQRVQKTMLQTAVPNLFFIPSGKFADNAGELFLGPSTEAFLRQMRDRFDFVVLDSAPVLAADDTPSLAPRTDGVIFVARSRFTRAKLATKAIEMLRQRQAKVLGLVYNCESIHSRDNCYYKYKEYYGDKRRRAA